MISPELDVSARAEAVLNSFVNEHGPDTDSSPEKYADFKAKTQAGIKRAFESIDVKRNEALEKMQRNKLAARQTGKRAPVTSTEDGLESLVAMQSKAKQSVKVRSLGLDPQNFLTYGVSTLDALRGALVVMFYTLSVVALCVVLEYSGIRLFEGVLAPTTIEKSAELQYNSTSNLTAAELLQTEGFEDPLASARNEAAIKIAFGGAAIAAMLGYWMVAAFAGVHRARSFLWISCPNAMGIGAVWLFYELGGSNLSGVAAALVGVLFAGLTTVTVVWAIIGESTSDTGFKMQYIAGKRAARLLKGGSASTKQLSLKKRLAVSVMGGLPMLFILGVLLLYTTLVFALFDAVPSTAGKLAVTLLALLIKVVGNKLLLKLVEKQPSYIVDFNLFCYEFATATLLRVLQMSIPDAKAAMLMSLFGALAEVCVRLLFFNRFMQAGLATNYKDMTAAGLLEYARWGKLRVMDGTNDMIVEYLSSLTAAMFLIYLVPTGAFSFATDDVVETSAVVALVMYQLVPEVFLDLYVTFMEIQGGLQNVHQVVWSLSAGGDPGSKYRVFRLGDFPKALACKLFGSLGIMFFVLLSVTKAN